jgi:hypothetical protein
VRASVLETVVGAVDDCDGDSLPADVECLHGSFAELLESRKTDGLIHIDFLSCFD